MRSIAWRIEESHCTWQKEIVGRWSNMIKRKGSLWNSSSSFVCAKQLSNTIKIPPHGCPTRAFEAYSSHQLATQYIYSALEKIDRSMCSPKENQYLQYVVLHELVISPQTVVDTVPQNQLLSIVCDHRISYNRYQKHGKVSEEKKWRENPISCAKGSETQWEQPKPKASTIKREAPLGWSLPRSGLTSRILT